MLRRVFSGKIHQTLASPWRRFNPAATTTATARSIVTSSTATTTKSPPPFLHSTGKRRVEDVMPIATGHEREELEAELEGRHVLEMNFPEGPFGTKLYVKSDVASILGGNITFEMESPAIVQSVFDKRIVGCPGVEGEDEHDVVWFWLEKGKPNECPVCSQYFKLEVVGPGGSPDGH